MASQSDMALTPSNRFCDNVHVSDFWGLQFLFSASFILKWICWRKKKGYFMSYDNFEHSCKGDGHAALSRGYSSGKNERLKLRNEEVWERTGGRKSKTLAREESHSNEIGSIWKVCFFYPNAHFLATSCNGPSEWDGASVRGRETVKPHERRLRLHLSF